MKKKVIWAVAGILTVALAAELMHGLGKRQKEQAEQDEQVPIVIWYTDPDIDPYMKDAAAEAEKVFGVEIQTEQVSQVDYIEVISERSMSETEKGPDLYVISSSQLEKAALAGLTTSLNAEGFSERYGEKAVHAVTYGETAEALPFYIDTSILVYNKAYTEEIPHTIDEILTYAENFEADETTEAVSTIFEWNVADVLENYMFMGAYTDLGGADGDNKEQVTLDLERIGQCMNYYQGLNGFFAIDADTISSDAILQKFVDGKTIYAVMNVPMMAQLDQQTEEGFYGTAGLPDLTEELQTRGMSVTNALAVNPYASNVETAEKIAEYLTDTASGSLYERAGKMPAYRKSEEEPAEAWTTVWEAYDQAQEVPKIMELSDMWLNLEVTLADIWRGEDAAAQMQAFSELIEERLD